MSGDMTNRDIPEQNSTRTTRRWSNDYLTQPTSQTNTHYPLDSSVSLDDFVLAEDTVTDENRDKIRATSSSEDMGNSKSKRKVSFNQVVEHSDSSCSMLEQDSDPEIPDVPENLSEVEGVVIEPENDNQFKVEAALSERSQEEPSLSFKTALESLSSQQLKNSDSIQKVSEMIVLKNNEPPEDEPEEDCEDEDCVDEERADGDNEEEEEENINEEHKEEITDYRQAGIDSCATMNCLPEKPPTAFQIFVNDFKHKYSERFAHLTLQEIIDLCTEIWREMGSVRKAEFQTTAAQLQREYSEKVKLYHAQREKPRTAYQIFLSDFLARENEKRRKMKRASKLTKLDLYQRGIRKWRRLKKSERADFQEQSRLSQLYARRNKTYSSVSEPIVSRRKF